MAETCDSEGLDVAPPSAVLVEALKKRLPPYASFQNPIDMTANVIFDPALMANTVHDVVQSREYDAVMLCVNLIWRQGAALSEQLAKLGSMADALVGVAWIAGKAEPLAHLNGSGVPVFSDPVRCVRAFAARLRWTAKHKIVIAEMNQAGAAPAVHWRADLGRFSAQESLLRGYGIDIAPCALVGNVEDAKSAALRLGYPVAAKLVARKLAHKSEIGGVYLNLDSDQSLAQAIAELDAIAMANKEGILIQKMISAPLEVFVGMKRDQVFGPVIVVGLGGIYVEIIRETVMRLAPVDEAQAERLIHESKFFPLLNGARGRPKLDVAALAKLVAHVSKLAISEGRILSLDLNPVLVTESSAQVVDFKIEYSE
jgi:acyl-CoA synthetase (NDP forming)